MQTDLFQRKPHWVSGCDPGFWESAGRFCGPSGETLPSWTRTCPTAGWLHLRLNWSWPQSLDRKPTCRPKGTETRWLNKKAAFLEWQEEKTKRATDKPGCPCQGVSPPTSWAGGRQTAWWTAGIHLDPWSVLAARSPLPYSLFSTWPQTLKSKKWLVCMQ